MTIMREEIFGPILPILPYRKVEEAISYINARPRPLALYYFGTRNGGDCRTVLSRTTSGNVTINNTLMHYVQDDLPFGGVGASGMGSYHGLEGFRTFSHRSEEHTSELQSLMRISYAGFCLKKKTNKNRYT